MGYAQLLIKRTDVDQKIRSELGKVLHEAERAAKIVRNLLAFVRPAEPQLAAVDINRVVVSVLESRHNELVAGNVRLEKKLAKQLPRTKADPNQIEQVITNLVVNAIQAMAGQAKPALLTVTTEENGFFIRIMVADTGPGISSEISGQIFDPFFTTKPPGKGTGLGLTISNGIIEEHQGKIWCESEPAKGAKFIVELPILPCDDLPDDSRKTAEPEPDPRTTKRRLLIVDDEPGILSVLVEVLGGRGYNVETACNGNEAMSRLVDTHYDLIISDLCMPEMDGRRFYEAVRERDPLLAQRIIFVTGDTVSNNSRAFLEGTGSRWLSKPFSIREVEELVGKTLRNEPVGPAAGKN
jgi:two-component system NtrC family sensor kinase